MAQQKFHLSARISSDSPAAVRAPLREFVGRAGKIKATDDGYEVEGTFSGESAKDLNRTLLSALRKVEKKTRLRAEWTSGEQVEKFFDYVPKGTRKLSDST